MPELDPLGDDSEGLTAEQKLRTALYLCIKDKGNIEELHKVFPPSLYYEFKRYIKLFLTDTYKRIHGDIEPIIPAICDRVVSDWKIAGKNRTDKEKAAIDSMEALKARYSQIPADQPQREELPDLLNTDKGRTVFDVLLKQGVVSFDGKMYKWEKTKALYGDIVDYLRGLFKVDDYTKIPWQTFGKCISNHATLVESAQGHLSKCRGGNEEQANGFVELKRQIEKAIRK